MNLGSLESFLFTYSEVFDVAIKAALSVFAHRNWVRNYDNNDNNEKPLMRN